MNVLPSQFALLERSLELASQNHEVVSQNIANVNTPHYKMREVGFEQELASLVAQGDAAVRGATLVVRPIDTKGRTDGNNVDIDRELGKLNHTATLFQTYTEILSTRLAQIRAAMDLR